MSITTIDIECKHYGIFGESEYCDADGLARRFVFYKTVLSFRDLSYEARKRCTEDLKNICRDVLRHKLCGFSHKVHKYQKDKDFIASISFV